MIMRKIEKIKVLNDKNIMMFNMYLYLYVMKYFIDNLID